MLRCASMLGGALDTQSTGKFTVSEKYSFYRSCNILKLNQGAQNICENWGIGGDHDKKITLVLNRSQHLYHTMHWKYILPYVM